MSNNISKLRCPNCNTEMYWEINVKPGKYKIDKIIYWCKNKSCKYWGIPRFKSVDIPITCKEDIEEFLN